jgi:hypothetical protein
LRYAETALAHARLAAIPPGPYRELLADGALLEWSRRSG